MLHTPKIPVLFIVPKIHKNKEKPPCRPIISGIGSLYSRLVAQSQSYLKDSRELIVLLQAITVTDNTLMVTVDTESLYTNIRHKDALEAVKWDLSKEPKMTKSQTKFLVEGLALAMSNNYFWALNDYYNQTGRCFGGTLCPKCGKYNIK